MAKGKYEYWLTDDGLLLLSAWARDGFTDEQIAKKMNISYSTFRVWRDKYPALSAALKKNKEIVDYEVENALNNNAVGYYYTEQVVVMKRTVTYKDGKRLKETSEPITIDLNKWKPAETTAQIYWTKNRRPKKWRDKPLDDNDDIMAAINKLVASNKEAANATLYGDPK